MSDFTNDALGEQSANADPFIATAGRRSSAEMESELFSDADDSPRFHWSIPWADLMMTMFIMFTVLFVYAGAKRDFMEAFRGHISQENVLETDELGRRPGRIAVQDVPRPGAAPEIGPQQLYEMARAAMVESGGRDVSVELEDNVVTISMHGPLLFDRGSAAIRPHGERFLELVANIAILSRYSIEIAGHTDNFPVTSAAYPTSWELSAARAVNAIRFMVEVVGLNPSQAHISAHSMYKPASPNITEEGKRRNRRIEAILRRPQQAADQPEQSDSFNRIKPFAPLEQLS